ncbi:MAG: DUF4189 domain-containing protein [Hyphomicrobiaceae bacterium]
MGMRQVGRAAWMICATTLLLPIGQTVAQAEDPPQTKAAGPQGYDDVAAAARTANPADAQMTLWESIKNKPDLLRLYLKTTPDGPLAGMARKNLAVYDARRKEKLIQVFSEVQKLLYQHNYNVSRFDGIVDRDTVIAIKAWQRLFGFPSNGTLNDAQITVMRQQPRPNAWGAIALPGKPGSGVYVANAASRREAEVTALKLCQMRTGSGCRAQTVHSQNCIAAFQFHIRRPDGSVTTGTSYARDVSASNAKAMSANACEMERKKAGAEGAECVGVAAVCGDRDALPAAARPQASRSDTVKPTWGRLPPNAERAM